MVVSKQSAFKVEVVEAGNMEGKDLSKTTQTKNVAWSDEWHFLLHHMDTQVHVYHLPGEEIVPRQLSSFVPSLCPFFSLRLLWLFYSAESADLLVLLCLMR